MRSGLTIGCVYVSTRVFLVLCPGARAIQIERDTYRMETDLAGGQVRVASPGGEPLLQIAPLVGITFADRQMLESGEMSGNSTDGDPLSIVLDHARAEVHLQVVPEPNRILFKARVTCRRGVILHIALPHTFVISGQPRERFLWPHVLGVELNGDFLSSDRRVRAEYPPAFCDFCGVQIGETPIWFYRCGREAKPRASVLSVSGGDTPKFRRYYRVYLREGEEWSAPPLACEIGGGLRPALLRYKRGCGLGRPLGEKLTEEFLSRWGAMADATIPGNFIEKSRIVESLPLPAIIEPWNWMFGAFDRKYPDFLPPNPKLGGEPGLMELVNSAHGRGHIVKPYVNFTWWCTGWDGKGSLPAPSYTEFGDIALSRNWRTEDPLFERYGKNFGFRVTPAHPVAVRRRVAVRDELLDRYGIDMLYEDQLGARRWPLDRNEALANPADYGWSLMKVGVEDAGRCPVETEFGHDRVLGFACALNYWCLPPLSAVAHWPGRENNPPWTKEQGRSYPYGLFLSSTDAVVNIPDCRRPARLAWAMALGGRISLGMTTLGASHGPEHEQTLFLQQLAQALGRTVPGDPLIMYEYLAESVTRSVFRKHWVTANFGVKPWVLEDGTVIAPAGFDLQTKEGIRAGRYLDVSGRPVSVVTDTARKEATILAAGSVALQLGGYTLNSQVPDIDASVSGRRTGILDFGPDFGAISNGSCTAETVREAFHDLDPIDVTGEDLHGEEIRNWRILVNCHSEHVAVRRLDEWPMAIGNLRRWCRAGGILAEIGGWPAWIALREAESGERPRRKRIGAGGFYALCGERCEIVDPGLARGALELTETGRSVLSADTARALEGRVALVTRPPAQSSEITVLCRNRAGGFLVVYPIGHGAVVRIAGVPDRIALTALAETVTAVLDGRIGPTGPVQRTETCRKTILEGQ